MNTNQMNTNQKVWFITGANKGIGAAIAQEALASGYRVVATARQVASAEKTLGTHPNLLIVPLDITNDQLVQEASKGELIGSYRLLLMQEGLRVQR